MVDRPNLAEVRLRSEIEDAVRAEFAEEESKKRIDEQDSRVLALGFTVTVLVAFGLPLVALILGASIRLGRWAAGF